MCIRWVARSGSPTSRRRTPPTCRHRSGTAWTTSAIGWTRRRARSSASWKHPTPRPPRASIAKPMGSSPTRSSRSPRAHEPRPGTTASYPALFVRAGDSGRRALGTDVGHVAHRLAQLGQPVVLVLGDEAHAPGERVRTRPRHAGVHERVEHLTLRLPQPGHGLCGEVGEQLLLLADAHRPADRAFIATLGLLRDRHPLVAGLLTERRNPSSPRLFGLRLAGAAGDVGQV